MIMECWVLDDWTRLLLTTKQTRAVQIRGEGIRTEKRESNEGAEEKGKNNEVIRKKIEGNYVLVGEGAVCRQTVMICPDEKLSLSSLFRDAVLRGGMPLGPMRLACNGASCDCPMGHHRFNHGSTRFLIHIP